MSESAINDPKVIEAEPATPVGAADTGTTRSERARTAAYRSRFALVYVVLAVVAGAGIGAFVVLLVRPDAAPEAHWSEWRPDGSASASVKQIADRVAKGYRLPSGTQIAIALASEPKVTAGGETGDLPVSAIAVRPDTSKGQAEEDDIEVVDASSGIQFTLCGLGASCSIAEGQPSEARHALLRREALELSLYTFKYVPDVDSVTVLLPPRPDGEAAPTTVFLRRSDVRKELDQPLSRTLGPRVPSIGAMPDSEVLAVNRITRPRLYAYEYTQAQDQSVIMVLQPILGT